MTIGFAVGLVVSVLGLAVRVIGQNGGGLVGCYVAGYLLGGGLGGGAWHGLLAGGFGELLLAVSVGVAGTTLEFAIDEAVSGPFGGAGLLVEGAFLAVFLALDSAIAGAIGGALRSG